VPARVPNSDNFRFNRFFKGVGRVANSARTSSLKEFRYRDALLTKLHKAGALDTIRAFKQKKLSVEELLQADRDGTLLQAADKLHFAKNLCDAVQEWFDNLVCAPASKKRYEVSFKRFTKKVAVATAQVAALEGFDWNSLYKHWGASGADWNRFRAMLSAFLTDFCGSLHHPFRLKVIAKLPRGKESPGVVPDLSVANLWKIVNAAPDGAAGAAFTAMAVLGVGPKELRGIAVGDVNLTTNTVRVRGTKTDVRDREVAFDPFFANSILRAAGYQVVKNYKWLRKQWLAACSAAGVSGVTMYALRHLSGQLAADAGLSDSAVAVHLGHANPSTTRRYTKRKVARQAAVAIAQELRREGAGTSGWRSAQLAAQPKSDPTS
jgi:integrase